MLYRASLVQEHRDLASHAPCQRHKGSILRSRESCTRVNDETMQSPQLVPRDQYWQSAHPFPASRLRFGEVAMSRMFVKTFRTATRSYRRLPSVSGWQASCAEQRVLAFESAGALQGCVHFSSPSSNLSWSRQGDSCADVSEVRNNPTRLGEAESGEEREQRLVDCEACRGGKVKGGGGRVVT
jgi:hypothetical protein